ncbi:MAG: DUF5681 domain-containing protein [Pyrinomonadaceae bacterium]
MQRENNDDGRDKRLANLRPFQKGQSGNPNGRPKSAMLSDALRRKMLDAMPDASEKTVADGIADALIKQALNGEVSAIKEVFDRTEGKVSQRIDADVNVFSWKAAIVDYGITPEEILTEAKRLLADEFENDNDESISE